MVIIGYHGTTRERAEQLILDPSKYVLSTNPGDWLGRGIYFWQDAPQRAIVWAKRNGLSDTDIAVVRAEINLEQCLDLFDLQTFRDLRSVYPRFSEYERRGNYSWSQEELTVQNGVAFFGKTRSAQRKDIVNNRDRALIDWYVEFRRTEGLETKSVRGVFLYGRAIYEQSFLFDWSHSQVAVIDPSVIGRCQLLAGKSVLTTS
jgi:hypothetical protein